MSLGLISQGRLAFLLWVHILFFSSASTPLACEQKSPGLLRIATFNSSLSRRHRTDLTKELEEGTSPQIRAVAETIGNAAPDILLLQEVDLTPGKDNLELFYSKFLRPLLKSDPYPHRMHFESNTGEQTPYDLDKDGKIGGPGDAQGYGFHHGHYAFALLSRFPIVQDEVRSYRKFLWRDLPKNHMAEIREGKSLWYSPEIQDVLRLSSKNHVLAPVKLPSSLLWLLASHPTPPVFDGSEDRNGWRNSDEIRFLTTLIDRVNPRLISDEKRKPVDFSKVHFTVLGDLNADPSAGDGHRDAISELLNHPRINPGTATGRYVPRVHRSSGRSDLTSEFGLRVDYVLPSVGLKVMGTGICKTPHIGQRRASDHHLVWVDVKMPNQVSTQGTPVD